MILCPNGADIENIAAGQLLVRQGRMFVHHIHILSLTSPTLRLFLLFSGVSKQDAQVALKGTSSGDKNELLFARFDTNYNDIPQRFRKGSTLYRARPTAAAPQDSGRSQQQPPRDKIAAFDADKTAECTPSREDRTAPEGSSGGEKSIEQQGGEETAVRAPDVVPVEFGGVAASPVDENPASEPAAGKPKAGQASPAPGKGGGDEMSGMSSKGAVAGKADTARADSAVVRVVSSGNGKGRSKRLLKKGHAPPGAIEEDACDLIRDDFWERNPHILSRSAASRR